MSKHLVSCVLMGCRFLTFYRPLPKLLAVSVTERLTLTPDSSILSMYLNLAALAILLMHVSNPHYITQFINYCLFTYFIKNILYKYSYTWIAQGWIILTYAGYPRQTFHIFIIKAFHKKFWPLNILV